MLIYEYDVFKMAHQMVLDTYAVTKNFPEEEKYGLTIQMRRSASSIPMNLAEGSSKASKKDFARFVDMASGSCEELRYQYYLAKGLGYIGPDVHLEKERSLESIKKMLSGLKQSLLEKIKQR